MLKKNIYIETPAMSQNSRVHKKGAGQVRVVTNREAEKIKKNLEKNGEA